MNYTRASSTPTPGTRRKLDTLTFLWLWLQSDHRTIIHEAYPARISMGGCRYWCCLLSVNFSLEAAAAAAAIA